jgi:hypothetical protein
VKRIWKRSTSSVEVAALPPGVPAAVRRHAERVGVADPLAGVTSACVTTSESLERRRFRKPPPPVDTYMLIAEPLLVVVADQGAEPVVSFHRLDEIELKEYDSTLVEDVGVELLGTAVGATERGMRFLPLDHGPAGTEFRASLMRTSRGS